MGAVLADILEPGRSKPHAEAGYLRRADCVGGVQEKQIRAKANIKQLQDRMRDQRQQVATRLQRNVRLLPKVRRACPVQPVPASRSFALLVGA